MKRGATSSTDVTVTLSAVPVELFDAEFILDRLSSLSAQHHVGDTPLTIISSKSSAVAVSERCSDERLATRRRTCTISQNPEFFYYYYNIIATSPINNYLVMGLTIILYFHSNHGFHAPVHRRRLHRTEGYFVPVFATVLFCPGFKY